jgi:hypothetical protein
MLGLLVTAILTSEFGWPTMFYANGALSTIWFVFWVFLVFDEPDKHPRISPEERDYIVEFAAQRKGPVTFPPLRDRLHHIKLHREGGGGRFRRDDRIVHSGGVQHFWRKGRIASFPAREKKKNINIMGNFRIF